MTAMGDDPPLLTDSDADALARDFLRSHYVHPSYAAWPLDRRLNTFLRRRGLTRVADDGDLFSVVLDSTMAYVGAVPRDLARLGEGGLTCAFPGAQ